MNNFKRLAAAVILVAMSASTVVVAETSMSAKNIYPLATAAVEEAGGSSVVAIVKDINSATRKVSLEFPNGKVVETTVKPDVDNLQNVNPGDKVEIDYVEAMLVAVEKVPTSMKGTAASGEKFVSPDDAGMPSETYAFVLEGIGVVQKVDQAKGAVTLDMGAGRMRTLQADEGVDLSGIAVGDTVKGVYVELISIVVKDENPLKPKME